MEAKNLNVFHAEELLLVITVVSDLCFSHVRRRLPIRLRGRLSNDFVLFGHRYQHLQRPPKAETVQLHRRLQTFARRSSAVAKLDDHLRLRTVAPSNHTRALCTSRLELPEVRTAILGEKPQNNAQTLRRVWFPLKGNSSKWKPGREVCE